MVVSEKVFARQRVSQIHKAERSSCVNGRSTASSQLGRKASSRGSRFIHLRGRNIVEDSKLHCTLEQHGFGGQVQCDFVDEVDARTVLCQSWRELACSFMAVRSVLPRSEQLDRHAPNAASKHPSAPSMLWRAVTALKMQTAG